MTMTPAAIPTSIASSFLGDEPATELPFLFQFALFSPILFSISGNTSRDNSDRSFSNDHKARWRRYLLPLSCASLCSSWCFPSDFNGSDGNDTFRRNPLLWLP
ncbi:uncharacterized protein DS421_15g505380 [Arachis hypogaea]|nr:uncharacterized protein DS421_15g505380 [Arachis hypogaea]